MSYYKNSIEYHDDLDAFEARMRAEEAERDYAKLVKVENTYGKNWEQDADNLRHVLENGNEMIENGEIAQWVGQEPTSNHDMLVSAGVVNADGSLKPYRPTGHASPPLSREEVTDFFGEEA